MPMPGGSNKLLDVKKTAEILGVSPYTIYRQWRPWGLTAFRIGRELRFRERDLWEWVAQREIKPLSDEPLHIAPRPQRGPVSSPTKVQLANRKTSQVPWTCPCGRTVRGGGGRSSHQIKCEVFQASRLALDQNSPG